MVNSARVEADNTSLTARNTLIGGKHHVSFAITNNSIIGEDASIIRAVFDYGGSGKERTMKFPLPMRELLYRYDPEDEELVDQVYWYDLDLDSVWEDGLEDGLRGIYFSLVDAQGLQQSNGEVYVRNPAEAKKGTPTPSDLIPYVPPRVPADPPAPAASEDPEPELVKINPSEKFLDVDPEA